MVLLAETEVPDASRLFWKGLKSEAPPANRGPRSPLERDLKTVFEG